MATLVIPVTVLVTLLAMKAAGLSFNLMTLGGIAAAIGLVIDDAIVVVEAIHTKRRSGLEKLGGHPGGHRRDRPAPRRLDADAGRRVHPAGLPRRASPASSSAPWP